MTAILDRPVTAPTTTTAAAKGDRRVTVLGTLVLVAGVLLGLSGAGTWAMVQTSLADEKITVAEDAARFGGEEFLIVLPETSVDAAAATMTRLQRELTRHYFLHENEKLLITFSAGVALRLPNEEQTALIRRADHSMYQAKKAGKNRVVIAE